MAASIMDLALQHKASVKGISSYSLSDLSRESGLNHSVISRAIKYQVLGENSAKQPTLATVKKMATTLVLAIDPELEMMFYNAFGHPSPVQLERLKVYIAEHQKEK